MNITTYDSDDLEPAVEGFLVRDHLGQTRYLAPPSSSSIVVGPQVNRRLEEVYNPVWCGWTREHRPDGITWNPATCF